MRERILDALTVDAVRLADLVGALDGEVSTGVFEAAVDELKASGEAELGKTKCTSCYPPHPVRTISSTLRPGNEAGSPGRRGRQLPRPPPKPSRRSSPGYVAKTDA
jgi:hypothetical protein